MRRTVLVTGCTTGSGGYALAKEYHARGLRVFATARKVESMGDLAELPGVTLIALDLTSTASIKAAAATVEAVLGPDTGLDLLINNAGIAGTIPALDETMDDVRMMFEVNVFGLITMVKEFLYLLMRSDDPCIVNVGSTAALVNLAFGASYNASKAAVHAYSDTLRIELRPLGVQVVTVILGGVKSNIFGYPPKPLTEDSYYAAIEDEFRKARKMPEKTASEPADYAREFVPYTLRASPPRHLAVGKGATMVTFFAWILPLSIMEWVIAKVTALNKLGPILRSEGRIKQGP